jgi:tRNA(Ile)-lysidine synthase
VDETNYDLNYSRNSVRANIINSMTDEEKNILVEKINKLNHKRLQELEIVNNAKKKCLVGKDTIDLKIFNGFDLSIRKEVLYYFIIENVYKKISISEGRLLDMIKKIASDKPNIVLSKYDDLIVYKEYDNLHIHKEDEEYCYKIDDLSNASIGERFQISDTGKKLEKVVVKKDEFPIYIKSYDGKNKDVNRIFIDKKVPLRQRKNWPMITNKFGTLLLVINIKKFYNILDNLSDEIIEFYVKEK